MRLELRMVCTVLSEPAGGWAEAGLGELMGGSARAFFVCASAVACPVEGDTRGLGSPGPRRCLGCARRPPAFYVSTPQSNLGTTLTAEVGHTRYARKFPANDFEAAIVCRRNADSPLQAFEGTGQVRGGAH